MFFPDRPSRQMRHHEISLQIAVLWISYQSLTSTRKIKSEPTITRANHLTSHSEMYFVALPSFTSWCYRWKSTMLIYLMAELLIASALFDLQAHRLYKKGWVFTVSGFWLFYDTRWVFMWVVLVILWHKMGVYVSSFGYCMTQDGCLLWVVLVILH